MNVVFALLLVAGSKHPGVSDPDYKALLRTKLAIYLPTYLPSGFKGKINVHVEKNPVMSYYSVHYTKGQQKFFLQTASDGIGDMMMEDGKGEMVEPEWIEVKHPAWGTIEIGFEPKTSRQFIVNWIEMKTKRMPSFISLAGEGISRSEVRKIVASVRRLN